MRIDYDELFAEAARAAGIPSQVVMGAREAIEKESYNVQKLIKATMPVDTRRAAATWGHADGRLVKENEDYDSGEAIWYVEDGGLTITQGLALNPYNYVEDLNAGSSSQAPAGFIDAQAERAGLVLSNELGILVESKISSG